MTPDKTHFLGRWKNWTIQKQVSLGMGSVSFLLLLIAAVSIVTIFQFGATFDGYRNTARQTHAADSTEGALLGARLAALKFRVSGDAESRDAVRDIIGDIRDREAVLEGYYRDDPDALASFDKIHHGMDEYREEFEHAASLQAERDELVERIAPLGAAAAESIDGLLHNGFDGRDIGATLTAGMMGTSVLTGRLYMEKFLVANRAEDFATSQQHLEMALQTGSDFLEENHSVVIKRLATEAIENISAYLSVSGEIQSVINDRNTHYAGLDKVGPQLISELDQLLDRAIKTQNTLGDAGASGIRLAKYAIVVLGVVSLLVAVVLANWIGNALSANVNRSISAMTNLASGQLDGEISGQDLQNEMGEMARALVVFRDNALQADRLEKDKQEAADRERSLKEKQAEQDRLAAERAQRQATVERERLTVMDGFRHAVKDVIAQAVDGDFSRRLDTGVTDQGLQELESAINSLLDNVEIGVSETGRVIKDISAGNLTGQMNGAFNGAFAQLQADVNSTLVSLNALIGDITERGDSVEGKSAEVKSAAEDMSRRTEQNAASLEQTSAALEEMSASVQQVATNVAQANRDAQIATQEAESGAAISEQAVAALAEIDEASKRMESIAGMIENIAFQINLLALNAGVESARAGEAGRGFAVVASEVRSLAQRSTDAVSEISTVISATREKVAAGVESVDRTQQTLDRIVKAADQVSEQMGSIAVSIDQQSTGIAEINSAVVTLDNSTQSSASSSTEVTAASMVLQDNAEGLRLALSEFRIRDKGGSPKVSRSYQTTSVSAKERELDVEIARNWSTQMPAEDGDRQTALTGTDDDGWTDF